MRVLAFTVVLAACHYHGDAVIGGDPDSAPTVDVAPPIDAPPGAWLEPWLHRKAVTIHGALVQAPTGGLIDFPVLIALDDADIAAAAKPDGSDLAVTGDDAMTVRQTDLESYVAGKLALWVKVPVLDNAVDTRLYLYYGNNDATAPDGRQVWTASYAAAWHLSQDPNNGTAGDIADATTNHHDGQAEASMTHADAVAGKCGPAIHFDGSNDLINVPPSIAVGDHFTISAWVFLEGGSSIKTIFSNSSSGLDKTGYRLFVDNQNQSDRMMLFETSDGNPTTHQTSTTAAGMVPAQQWNHVAVIADRAAGTAKLFVNGVDRTVGNGIVTGFQNTAKMTLGRMGDAFSWVGEIDQIEVATEERPTQWIATSFTNQNDPPSFYAVGAAEAHP